MNLKQLFETQNVLRERIGYKGPDRFEKLALSLLVELGECANEWRGFKFWSKNQKPKSGVSTSTNTLEEIEFYLCGNCNKTFDLEEVEGLEDKEECDECRSYLFGMKYTNPLLEEFVDGLHFILELGIEMGFKSWGINELGLIKHHSITGQFNYLFNKIGDFEKYRTIGNFECITDAYVGLGEMLGFTWEQIEKAYFDKNKINHQRQSEGY